ncbi:MAG: HAMP domain-containing protein [Firmicutes bacterium]|nr:HAMP domain-containing protein [Bacillota bacterium]
MIVALIFVVLSFSVAVQSERIKSFIYNQQAQFYIYETQEVATIIKNEQLPDIVNERLHILAQFLNATIMTYDKDGNVTRAQQSIHEGNKVLKLDKNFLSEIWRGENIIHTGRISNYPVKVFLVAVPIIDDGKITGAVAIYSPLSFIQKNIDGIRRISLWAALLGMGLATIVSIFILRRMTKPLLNMEEVAHAIADGDFGKQVSVDSSDEVGRLASSLNNMSVQLKEKIEAIERLDKTRQEFVSNVSHELRTPLTVIQSFSEAILDGMVKTEKQRDFYLDNILQESKRLRRLVDDLLDLKALESGSVIDDMDYVIVSKLITVTTGNFESLAQEKDIELLVKPYPKELTVYGNVDRLKQVITNLIGNAIAYTKPGGTVTIAYGKSNNNEIYISITDTGPGIATEELEQIWERFYKVDKSRARKTQGTGLGLAIAKKIIELHNGNITAESAVGKGSTFTAILPSADV